MAASDASVASGTAELEALSQRLADTIKTVDDFPKPGIAFKDITPVCADSELMGQCAEAIAQRWRDAHSRIAFVAGIEARGFIFAPLVAQQLDCGFIPVRKPDKLPRATFSVDYELEYGTNTLEIHQDSATAGDKILLVDDLLATGGTAEAAIDLLERNGAEVVGCGFIVDLEFLGGKARLGDKDFFSLLTYS